MPIRTWLFMKVFVGTVGLANAASAQSPAPPRPPTGLHITLQADGPQTICAGSRVPGGWIVVDDSWSSTSCGNPVAIAYNVWTIDRYDNKPVGQTMNVCASAPTPANWMVAGTTWSPNSCGHPTSNVQNVKTIKKLK